MTCKGSTAFRDSAVFVRVGVVAVCSTRGKLPPLLNALHSVSFAGIHICVHAEAEEESSFPVGGRSLSSAHSKPVDF